MLSKYKNKTDIDGYSMLVLSLLVMTATAGLSYFYFLIKTFSIAKKTSSECNENVLVCVLGKKLINEKPDHEYTSRLNRVTYILKNDEKSQAILLGGKTGKATISEAFAGKEYLLNENIHSSRINLEEASVNTIENFKNAMTLINDSDQDIIVVTNRYHLARAKKMAEGFGLDIILCAAEKKLNIDFISVYKLIIEALHVHWYICGHYYAHLTNNERIINRVG